MRAILAKFVTAVLGAGLMMTATAALACNSGCAPPAPPTRPTPPTTPSCGCETGGGGGHHGHGGSGSHSSSSADVNVNVNVKTSSSASGSAASFGFSSAGSSSGGGYGNWSQTPGTPENAGGLAVDTGQGGAAFDMISEQRTVTRTLVLQASCIDDTGVPHPASQVSAERAIANEYTGEVYRCIAGTHMQVTMADFGICDDFGGQGGQASLSESESSSYSRQESHSSSAYDSGYSQAGYAQGGYVGPDGRPAGPCGPQAIACSAGESGSHGGGYAEGGESHETRVATGGHRAGCANMDLTHVNFDGGKTMTCQKGDALWFDHGNMSCKVQIAQRQCNERSLLRRFGVGLKVLTVTRTETMQRQVARQVERSSSTATVMTFDGGVGGFVE